MRFRKLKERNVPEIGEEITGSDLAQENEVRRKEVGGCQHHGVCFAFIQSAEISV